MEGGESDRRAAERDAADARYNEALTNVDRALPRLPAGGPPGIVRAEMAPPLRAAAATVAATPAFPAGWRGRFARLVWGIVGPAFERQQAFNMTVASELERGDAARRESLRAVDEWCATMRAHLDACATFDSRLVQYLQQITPFVDTKVRVVEQALEELRMAAASAQRSAVAARREVERLAGGAAVLPDAAHPPNGTTTAAQGGYTAGYVGFEDVFRGSSEEIRARQRDYADRFAGATDVLDIGCGRGELLDMLRERGISARGVEANPEMAEVCRARGLDVSTGDALPYLGSLPDASLGGLVALQVVEHLEPGYLVRLIETAHAKLRPGALIVLETINAACWVAFFESYVRDITHVRPLHPDTLKFLVVAAGFERVDVHFRSPVTEQGRLQAVASDGLAGPLAELAEAFNRNVERLNDRLFTYLDYAIIGVKGP